MIKVKGIFDEWNINVADNQFYLIDEKKDKHRIEVKVLEMANQEVLQKLFGNGGQPIMVEGEIEGFDAPTNPSCNRYFILYVSNAAKVRL